MKIIHFLLPNQDIDNAYIPVMSILIGGLIKYGLGGSIFDFVGHIVIFIGSINIFYYLRKGREDKLNVIVGFIIIALIFLGAQIAMNEIVVNMLGIKPLF